MENINKTVLEMVDSGTLVVSEEQGIPGQGAFVGDRRRRWVGLSTEERRIGRENFGIFTTSNMSVIVLKIDFYCFLLWPFIETYWLASVSLFCLVPDTMDPTTRVWVDERIFLNRVQFFGKTLYYEGNLPTSSSFHH